MEHVSTFQELVGKSFKHQGTRYYIKELPYAGSKEDCLYEVWAYTFDDSDCILVGWFDENPNDFMLAY
jgi:hypothetical protein